MKDFLRRKILDSLQSLGLPVDVPLILERPRQAEHGDLTTNVAMVLGKQLKRNPRELAALIIRTLDIDRSFVNKVECAGPGFINVTFTDSFFRNQLKEILENSTAYGRSGSGRNIRVQVEFVSANPTGPLTVGHGRGAVYGDTVARLLEWTGHQVEREYYFNNAGRQMRILGDSVRLRYLEELGDTVEFPADYYQGEYIRDIARSLKSRYGDALRNEPAEGRFKAQAEEEIFADIRKTLKALGVEFDSYFNENSLYTDGKIREVIEELRARGLVFERDGALWFKTSAMGADQDKVIVKGSGEPTYRLPDIAYHREKYRRGFDRMIDVLGADHIASYPDVLAGLKALGLDPARMTVLIHQFVTITQNGEAVKMSTRKANFITLDELIADVGADVVRYFFLMRTISSHLNFDLGLAREQSEENPVYYLQYGHARVSSILRYAEKERTAGPGAAVNFDLLTAPEELDLIRLLLRLPEVVESCAETYEPHRLAEYLHDVAASFHKFYHICRVVTDDRPLTAARLALCRAVATVLRNGLNILGISAPERM